MSRAVSFSEFGPASVLEIIEVDAPLPAPGKVRIALRAAGLNPWDSKVRSGATQQWAPVTFPARLGRELAGIVDAVGEGVTTLAVGDEVFGNVAGGALADFAIGTATALARRPAGLSWEIAGSMSTVGLTAWEIVESQSIGSGDTVLVSAAAGGVGSFAAQLARRAGATVIGTASVRNHDFLRELGVIPVAYGDGLADRVRALATSPVTVVLDHHGAETIEAGLELGVERSRINTTAADADALGIRGVGRGKAKPAVLEELAALIVAGDIRFEIEASYPLERIVEAFAQLDDGHVRGKLVVTP